jgi:hypothetical protein
MTYRSEPEDISRPITFDIAFLGYTRELSVKGLRQFAKNNEEQILKFNKSYDNCVLYLKDGTKITTIGYSKNWCRGYKFDQLILFDDDRWLIEFDKMREIYNIILGTMYISNVPEEFKILKYEDIRD